MDREAQWTNRDVNSGSRITECFLFSPLRLRRLPQRQIGNHAEHDGHRREDDDVGPQRQHVEVELRHHLATRGRARRERHCESGENREGSSESIEKESQRCAFNQCRQQQQQQQQPSAEFVRSSLLSPCVWNRKPPVG